MDNTADTLESNEVDNQPFFLPASKNEVIRIGVLGAALGLVIPLISFLLERFFIIPVFCQSPDSFGICASGGLTAYYVATGLLSAIAIALMAQWQIFRPALIAVGVAAALWGLKRYVGELSVDGVFEHYLYSVVLFSLSYILFYWLMRVRAFALSVLVAVIFVACIRWAVVT